MSDRNERNYPKVRELELTCGHVIKKRTKFVFKGTVFRCTKCKTQQKVVQEKK
jgi:hypothetical protein